MPDHYIETIDTGLTRMTRIWLADGDGYIIPVSDTLLPRIKIEDFQGTFAASQLHKLSLAPGGYYPRMARPNENETSPGSNPASERPFKERAGSTGQLHALIGQLERVCTVVHPEGRNLKSYGHDIRNILILACTEVETQWKNILKANTVKADNTRDYVKLAPAMRLNEYSVSLNYYPWLSSTGTIFRLGRRREDNEGSSLVLRLQQGEA